MKQFEYGEMYSDDVGTVFFEGDRLTKDGYGIFDTVEGLNLLGSEGWELVLKYKDKHKILNFVMKREL